MPDPITILAAIGVAFGVSAFSLAIFGWRGRTTGTSAIDVGWALGVGAGFFLGCCVLGRFPRWPPREDQDRLLLLVMPSVVVVELLAAFPRLPRWMIWPLRAALVVGVAPVLLYGTSYLSDQDGPGTAEWSAVEAWLILSGLAAILASVWSLLALLSARAPEGSHAVCLAIASAGAAVTVMLSGYVAGGQDGLPLAGALLGVAVSTFALGWSSRGTRPLGVGIVTLYSLVVIGRFFGDLSSFHAILLLGSPLLGWLAELPLLRRLPRWARELVRVLLVGLFVSAIVVAEVRKLGENSPTSAGSESEEPTAQDYMKFGAPSDAPQ